MVGDTLGVLPVEVEAVLYQELHRLGFYDILLHAQQGEIEHLSQVRIFTLRNKRICLTKNWEETPPPSLRSQLSCPIPGMRVIPTLSGCCLKQARPSDRTERVLAA